MTTGLAAAANASHDLVPGWLLLAIYVAGFVITARIVFITYDGKDRADDRLVATCAGVIWPLALAAVAVCGLLALPTLGAKTKRDRRIQAQFAARERQMQVRIADFERRRLASRIAELEAEDERWRKGGQP